MFLCYFEVGPQVVEFNDCSFDPLDSASEFFLRNYAGELPIIFKNRKHPYYTRVW
jgi:hypothetical protein